MNLKYFSKRCQPIVDKTNKNKSFCKWLNGCKQYKKFIKCVCGAHAIEIRYDKDLVAKMSNIKQIWYHGTNRTAARSILKEGFKSGTYFAKHLEDAIGYGGPFVFGVMFEDNVTILNDIKFWQRIIPNRYSRTKIVSFKVYTEKTLFENKKALERVFESNLKFFNKG